MVRRCVGAALLLAFATAWALPVGGADKKDDKNPADVVDADKLPPGQFTGKLKTVPGSDGALVVTVEYQHLELKNPNQLPRNPNKQMQNLLRDQQHIAQLQQQVANASTARQQTKAMQQLQQAMNQAQNHLALAQLTPQQSPFNVKTDHKDITFHAAEEVKVRFNSPPTAFDDKGNPKKYTADELKELKGTGDDAKLVGYAGTVEKLTVGMPVRVTTILNKPKKEEKKPEEKKADDDKKAEDKDLDKDKVKDKEKDAPADKKDPGPKTIVSLILVLGDENSGTGGDSTDPKKKKKN